MNVLDLFSGIGGFSLGLERAGMRTVAFCEQDAYCRAVLARHWPDVPCYDDVRTLTADTLRRDRIAVDAICGGFPCQDISKAGPGEGLAGSRSGLWFEYARLIRELRPAFAIVENVAEMLRNGMGDVLGSLAEIGFDAEWECVPASAVGAPHGRDRVWIVAYPRGEGLQGLHEQGWREHLQSASPTVWGHWSREPDVARVADGVPRRLVASEIKALGNAVVPQIAYLIGRAIMQAERP